MSLATIGALATNRRLKLIDSAWTSARFITEQPVRWVYVTRNAGEEDDYSHSVLADYSDGTGIDYTTGTRKYGIFRNNRLDIYRGRRSNDASGSTKVYGPFRHIVQFKKQINLDRYKKLILDVNYRARQVFVGFRSTLIDSSYPTNALSSYNTSVQSLINALTNEGNTILTNNVIQAGVQEIDISNLSGKQYLTFFTAGSYRGYDTDYTYEVQINSITLQ